MKTINKKDIQQLVGQQIKPTDWFTVTQDQIDMFADCTLDHQFIHVDPDKAKKTPFGSTIAHGFLSLSMLPYFAENFMPTLGNVIMGINYGFDRIRFIAPVKVDSRIRANSKLLSVAEKKPGQFVFTMDVSIEIENIEKPALQAIWIGVQVVA